MKTTVLLLASIFIYLFSNAQITLENYYQDGVVKYVKFHNIGEKYFVHEKTNSKIKIYNLNHSIYKTIDIPASQPSQYYTVLLLSDKLFNIDSDIEFVINNNKSTPEFFKVYKEDGTELLSLQNFSVYEEDNYIFNTANGTKLVVGTDSCKVYNLGGSYIGSINRNNFKNGNIFDSYPNPTNNFTRIDYQLPSEINEGLIIIYDTNGNQVKFFNVDNSFDHLMLTTTDLQSGTYYYSLKTKNGISNTKKMIVIK